MSDLSVTIQGKVVSISDPIRKTDSFSFIEVVIDTTGSTRYPNSFQVQFSNTKQALASGLKVGDSVEVKAYLSSRAWTNPRDNRTSYFVTVSGQEMVLMKTFDNMPAQSPGPVSDPAAHGDDPDDLPF